MSANENENLSGKDFLNRVLAGTQVGIVVV